MHAIAQTANAGGSTGGTTLCSANGVSTVLGQRLCNAAAGRRAPNRCVFALGVVARGVGPPSTHARGPAPPFLLRLFAFALLLGAARAACPGAAVPGSYCAGAVETMCPVGAYCAGGSAANVSCSRRHALYLASARLRFCFQQVLTRVGLRLVEQLL